ncbi:MAG TPA: choice-of-anchor A family protein [Tepidisphaeraceae bacterium]|nr:choice-of-anchor A family protein [Tepidisphaeraceae bacterium]
MRFIGIPVLAASVVLGLSARFAPADVLGPADGYDALIFQNMTSGSDSEGALAIGGTFNLNGYSVASHLGTTGTHLVVGGNLNMTGGSINGDTYVGGTATINNAGPAGNLYTDNYAGNNGPNKTVYYTGTYSGPSWINHTQISSFTLPVDFATAQTQLTQTSSALAGLVNTGTLINNYNSLIFSGTNSGLNIFSVDASLLAGCYGVTVSIPSGAYALINITGSTSVTLPNVGFTFDANNVLWNLSGVNSLTMTSFSGSVLAPGADVSTSYGQFDGTLVAKSFTGNTELHNYSFNHDIPTSSPGISTVPLPASAYAGLALLAGLGIYRRVRSAAN